MKHGNLPQVMIDKKSLVAYNRALVNYFKNNLKEYTEKKWNN